MSAVPAPAVVGAEDFEPYRRELVAYCYRMLGSVHEAEDAVQDTMLRAWRALGRFEERAGLRPWLYRIATNVCIDMLKGRARRARPVDVATAGNAQSRLVEARPETTWIQPVPDHLVLPVDGDPAALAVSRESVRLAFVAALQHLAPRPRAVLILRDVLGWRAAEVALLLDTSVDAVNSSLRRARTALGPIDRDTVLGRAGAGADGDVLAAYVDAFERYDVDALVRLLRDDAIVEMPPFELWLQGRDEIRQWLIAVDALRDHHLRPVEANGSPAAAVYVPREPGGPPAAFAIHVLDIVDGRIGAIHSYIDPGLFELFGLPAELPAGR